MDSFLEQIAQALSNATAQAGIIAVMVEFALRMVKSQKPLSIAYAVASGFRGLGVVATKAAEFLDKVLPQRLKL